MTAHPAPTPLLSVKAIAKAFGGAQALQGVDLDFQGGEVHALCGENGAGKSTLIEILAGNHHPDSGTIEIEGHPVHFKAPIDALRAGIAVIHQEFSLVDDMTVADNLALGNEPRKLGFLLDRATIHANARRRLAEYGLAISTRTRVGQLPTGQRQLVEIIKALGRQARMLILDEPTAALTRAEAERLFEVIAQLRAREMSIVYVSHHLDEVLRISDRVTVLRDGKKVDTWPGQQLSPGRLMSAMVGSVVEIHHANSSRKPSKLEAIRVDNLSGRVLKNVSFQLFRGEILGATGLAGAGHEELARILFGAEQPRRGKLTIGGIEQRISHPAQAIAEGMASIPADRRREGLLSTLDIERNLTITRLKDLSHSGWIKGGRRRRLAQTIASEFQVAYHHLSQKATTLSGGNQQKVIIGRWMANRPSILILNDPTRGIDVKTREAIHARIDAMADQGIAILLVTSDVHELRRLADRFLIFRRGELARTEVMADFDEQTLLSALVDDPGGNAFSTESEVGR